MSLRLLCVIAVTLLVAAPAAVLAQEASTSAAHPIHEAIESIASRSPGGIDVTAWVGGGSGAPSYERGAKVVMPTASAIKAFYLVEFFAANPGRLDQPLDDASRILVDEHPAISHFTPQVRDEIRRELTTSSVRRVGLIMQGHTDVSNAVYNAAANLVTAHLGGPEKLTERIHARDPRFQPVVVRRYMLRDRSMPGDNEATAESIAALYQSLASRKLNGISEDVMTAVHDVLKRPGGDSEPLFYKDGALGSNPLTSVRAGWKQTSRGPLVFVFMCRQPVTDPAGSSDDYKRLQALSASFRERTLGTAGREAKDPPLTHTQDSFEVIRANVKSRKAVLLDVRDRDEWDEGHLADAKLLPLRQLRKATPEDLLNTVSKDTVVYTYCVVGKRALDAGRILEVHGYDVRPLSAGYDELRRNGFEQAP